MKKLNSNGFIDIEVKQLIDWDEPNGEGCLVSDRITKDGCKVGYMYREEPDDSAPDSGWRFMAGDEDDTSIIATPLSTPFGNVTPACHR